MAFRRRRGGTIRSVLEVALFVAALWLAGLIWYAHEITRLSVAGSVEDTPTADAVVVLTGSTDRLTLGFELLAAARAQRLFISGVYRGVDVQQILRALRRSPREAENAIMLGYGADDTAGNAQETSVWMAKAGLTSLILVTSNFHMPRALVEFHAAMPQVTIIPRATAAASFKIDEWWRWPGTIRLIASEWTKYVAARTSLALDLRITPRPLVSPAPMEPFSTDPQPASQDSAEPPAGPGPPQPGPVPPEPPSAGPPGFGIPAPQAPTFQAPELQAPEFETPAESLPEGIPDTLPSAPETPSVPRPAAPE